MRIPAQDVEQAHVRKRFMTQHIDWDSDCTAGDLHDSFARRCPDTVNERHSGYPVSTNPANRERLP
jgi:hypothetical protein